MPSVQGYLKRGLETAEQQGYEMVILQLNTPGGSIETMKVMVQDIRASRIPVIVYVTPRGGWAASAGAVITLAGHASAMSPETAIGAASPVGSQGEDLGETMASQGEGSPLGPGALADHPPQPCRARTWPRR